MLTDIPPMPRGAAKLEVTYDIDVNGILNVTASEKSTGLSKNIQIKNDAGRLSQSDIDRMVSEADKFKEDDRKNMEMVNTKNELDMVIYSSTETLQKLTLDDSDRDQKEKLLNDTRNWLDSNPNAQVEDYKKKIHEIQHMFTDKKDTVQDDEPTIEDVE
mgnify:FL=1